MLKEILTFVIIFILLLGISACKHSPAFLEDDFMIIDTTENPIDSMPVDTTQMGDPCDPDVVYFEFDILPLLRSNCALSGCHDAITEENGINLESYESVIATAEVEPFDLEENKIYEVLVDDDEEDRMPPTPRDRLSADQIQLIAKWILQGAENLSCDPDAGQCDTTAVSFNSFVMPVIDNTCAGCHSGNTPSGGIDLTTYNNIVPVAEEGRLFGAISWQGGFENMPQGGNQLNDCTIDKIKSWIDAGTPEN